MYVQLVCVHAQYKKYAVLSVRTCAGLAIRRDKYFAVFSTAEVPVQVSSLEMFGLWTPITPTVRTDVHGCTHVLTTCA